MLKLTSLKDCQGAQDVLNMHIALITIYKENAETEVRDKLELN